VLQVGRLWVQYPIVSLEFFIDVIFPSALWPWDRLSLFQKWVPGIFPGVKGGRCVGLTTLPPSCADCLEIWESHHPGSLRACPNMCRGYFIVTLHRDQHWRGKVLKNNLKYVIGGSTVGSCRGTTCTLSTEQLTTSIHLSATQCYLANKSNLHYRLTFSFLHSPDVFLSLLCNCATDSVVKWNTKELYSPCITWGLTRDADWKMIQGCW
jgi:hypothetical protein